MKKISVSFLSSKKVIDCLIDIDLTDANYIHVDVMDGKFVKNKYLPYKTLYKMSSVLQKRLDVHLMVKDPKKYIEKYANLNTEYITIHSEIKDIDKYIDLIKSYKIKVGLAINPDTDISIIKDYIYKIDLILLMSVTQGREGQNFIEDTTKKISEVKKIIKNEKVLLEVDGGINDITIKKANVDIIVSGSFITSSSDFQEQINKLR